MGEPSTRRSQRLTIEGRVGQIQSACSVASSRTTETQPWSPSTRSVVHAWRTSRPTPRAGIVPRVDGLGTQIRGNDAQARLQPTGTAADALGPSGRSRASAKPEALPLDCAVAVSAYCSRSGCWYRSARLRRARVEV